MKNQPRLILFNGPLGIGKSTLAEMYSQRHPLTLNLDMDLIRDRLGQWREHRRQSEAMAWEMACQMAEIALKASSDVVIAHTTRQPAKFAQLEELAQKTDARLHEILLLAPKVESIRRFVARGQLSGFKLGYRPGGLIGQSGGMAWVESMYDEVADVAQQRSQTTTVINPNYGEPEETYRQILALVGRD